MKKSPKCAAIKRNNQASNSKGTPENPMSTSKVSTSQDRYDMRIPKTSKIYQYLHVDIPGNDTPNWRRLDALLTRAEDNSADHVSLIFEEFLARIKVFHPGKVKKIEQLRALILWHILWDEPLEETYRENIKELLI